MLFLSGGTGTPKLLRGFKEVIDPEEINVVANTGDDIWLTNTYVCPDVDTVLYTLAEIIDDEKWWGIKDDSFRTNNFLNKMGYDEFMDIGDKDRAIHLLRTNLLANHSLTETIEIISNKLGIEANVFPMTDYEVDTIIKTSDGEKHHFQEWWIKYPNKEVSDVYFEGIDEANPSKRFLRELNNQEKIVIGPSNPVTSIYPIISLGEVREKLKQKKVISISPFIGNEVVSGPANRLMKAINYEPNSNGVNKFYSDFLDKIIVDKTEKNPPSNSIKTDIMMNTREDEKRLAKFVIKEVFS